MNDNKWIKANLPNHVKTTELMVKIAPNYGEELFLQFPRETTGQGVRCMKPGSGVFMISRIKMLSDRQRDWLDNHPGVIRYRFVEFYLVPYGMVYSNAAETAELNASADRASEERF